MPAVQHRRRKIEKRSRPDPIARQATTPEHFEARRVIIATDGSAPASAAMRIAKLMSAHGYWTPSVLTVMQPLPVSVGEMMLPAPPVQFEVLVGGNVAAGIRKQLRRHGDIAWGLSMEFGRAVPLIVEAALERKAELIVLGLGRHGRLARMLGAETTSRVVRHATVPVLAVEASARSLPKVALAAVDFSDSSIRAAREALALIEPPGRLHLVHVKWTYNMTSFADSEWERAYGVAVKDEFARLQAALGTHKDIDVTTALLTGSVVEKVLNEAKSVHANVVALGSHSQNVFDRMTIGSTPAQVLRSAPCSVLVAPPANAKP